MAHFLEAQGYKLKHNIMYQDNQSAMLLEKNGRTSCTGNSRHVNVRFFWVKDRVDKKELSIEYCPTERMVAAFYTKLLQGNLFQRLKEIIMGWKPITALANIPSKKSDKSKMELKERVEK